MTTAGAGIDVSRHTLNIHINGRDDSATNDTDGFRKVAGILRRGKAERAVMEATGRMHRALLQSLHDRGFAVAVVNPRQCRDLPRPGAPGRTGRAGAGVPAAFGAAFPDMAPAAPADVTAGRLRDMPGLRGAPVDRRAEPRRFPPGSESRIPTGPSRGCSYEPPPVKRFLHDVSHRSVSSLGRLGASRGFSRRNIAFQGAPNTRRRVQAPVRFGWPADAGPVTRVPRSGGATFREGGTHLDGRCRGMRRTMPPAGHTPCPGSPGGRRAARVFGVRCSPPPTPAPSTGRRPRAPARWWRTAPAPRAASRAAPRSRACPAARRGRSRIARTTPTARCRGGGGASARPSAPGVSAASGCRPCLCPGRGPPRRPATAPAPARRDWPARAGCAGPGRTAPRPAAARRSGRSPSAGPAPPRGGRAPGQPPARLRAASPPPVPTRRRHPVRRPQLRDHQLQAAGDAPDLGQKPRRQSRAAGGPHAPSRARYPFRAGSPGGMPCSLRSPATAFASRRRSRTSRSRLGGRRLPSSSATVGIRTGDIASRSPPSQDGGARTILRAPVRSVFAFLLRRTTSRLAGSQTTTPRSSPSRRRASRKPPYPAPWTSITRTSPPETAAARSRARTGFASSPSTSCDASPYRPVRDASDGSPTARIQPVPLTCSAAYTVLALSPEGVVGQVIAFSSHSARGAACRPLATRC